MSSCFRWKEVFEAGSMIFQCYTNGFITELPEVCSVVFDRLVTVTYDKDGDPVVKSLQYPTCSKCKMKLLISSTFISKQQRRMAGESFVGSKADDVRP
jgi:hypothetical protein